MYSGRLAGVEQLVEPERHLVDAVGPVARGVLPSVPTLGEIEDDSVDGPLERLQVDP